MGAAAGLWPAHCELKQLAREFGAIEGELEAGSLATAGEL